MICVMFSTIFTFKLYLHAKIDEITQSFLKYW